MFNKIFPNGIIRMVLSYFLTVYWADSWSSGNSKKCTQITIRLDIEFWVTKTVFACVLGQYHLLIDD